MTFCFMTISPAGRSDMKQISLTPLRSICAALMISAVGPLFAQACSGMLPIVSGGVFSGSTCSGSNQLPVLTNGAMQSPGPQSIYELHDLSAQYLNLTLELTTELTAEPNSLSLYVCRNPCSAIASCVAVADTDATGKATINLPKPDEYFVVVGSASGTCSNNYSLLVFGTFND
jgi:hypothetical protein